MNYADWGPQICKPKMIKGKIKGFVLHIQNNNNVAMNNFYSGFTANTAAVSLGLQIYEPYRLEYFIKE
jgi:hypothetical protein